ncbi:hypothetical protein CALCODRAFT_265574 [Calocera cornea HHB12733]|uniref:Uncharacterized protein n=1 Tax=Calocera cornea HHB12733 TaxID=1353952 RepID=A0A165GE30_9BASI|nr:hypothetical protein CALCODRAFT_265574 [Calocera cornea HHB12733]
MVAIRIEPGQLSSLSRDETWLSAIRDTHNNKQGRGTRALSPTSRRDRTGVLSARAGAWAQCVVCVCAVLRCKPRNSPAQPSPMDPRSLLTCRSARTATHSLLLAALLSHGREGQHGCFGGHPWESVSLCSIADGGGRPRVSS